MRLIDAVLPDARTDSAIVKPRPTVLLVDDDDFMLEMQATMLRSMGCPVVTAASAETALRVLHTKAPAPDVIMCDLLMPGVDGIEFLQTVNKGKFGGSVILASGQGARIMHAVQTLLRGSDLLILGAFEKPVRRQALLALLDRWEPRTGAPARSGALEITCAELHAANLGAQWLLHYQPKVDLRMGEVIGMEALVRWEHPVHGLVYPDRFIATAEECGAIDGLTEWVLQEAMRQQVRWQQDGLKIEMAVNISMENLRVPGFAHQVAAWARQAGASPLDIVLEVTESRLMRPSPVPLENLVRLRMQCFGLSIDDFGTGHSSLAQLRDVPFTELKIDRGFVHGARHDPIARPILEASIEMARRLTIRAVAEGIETEDDWQMLREIGCEVGQGWFIGRPMAAALVPAWFAGWRSLQPALQQS